MNKHLILIGFKNVGKSAIGRKLAQMLDRKFLDLDEVMERLYEEQAGVRISCRKILQERGEQFFRQLERRALDLSLKSKPSAVVSAGGGTPLDKENQRLLRQHMVVLLKAPKGIVYERIMVNGKPAFFPEGEDPLTAFRRILSEREPVYESLAEIKIENTGSIQEAAEKIISQLSLSLKP